MHGVAPRVSNDERGTGVFACGRGLGLDQIHDGAAHTFTLGERAMHTSDRGAGIWMRSTNAAGNSPDATAIAGVCHATARLNDRVNLAAFSSSHSGGGHFVFADGSVRFIDETIDMALYVSFADRGRVEQSDSGSSNARSRSP